MISYNILTGSLYKDWKTAMEVIVEDSSLTFIEHIFHVVTESGTTARTLTISDIQAFERAIKTDVKDLEIFLKEKNSRNILSIEHLQRLCERYKITYNLTGDSPYTAQRKYIKTQKENQPEQWVMGYNLWRKALLRTTGKRPGTPKNLDKALELLKESISFGYHPAYALLAQVYRDKGMETKAMATVNTGIKLGDSNSMIKLAQWLSEDSRKDYNGAAKLYIAASENGGYNQAAKGLHRLISEGKFTPKGDMYMKLIICVARDQNNLTSVNPEKNSQFRNARNILFSDSPDVESVRNILTKALKNGYIFDYVYEGLAICDILEKQWGKALENALRGIEAGDTSTCLAYAARLALMGTDFVNFSDELGEPDYEAALKWSKRCIDEDATYGFKVLYHLVEIGYLKIEDLDPELIERCEHYANNTPKDKISDISLSIFDKNQLTRP